VPARARGASGRDALDRGLPALLGTAARQIRDACRGEKELSHDVEYSRLIDATPDEVFAAFTDPEGQEAFYGQDDEGWIVESSCDLRVGGVWTVHFGPSRRELYVHRHVFEVIERPRRLVMASTEIRLDGSSFHTKLEFSFEEREGKTLMTMSQRGFPTTELRDEHERGIPNAFSRLERVLKMPS
jgi:uncharacterized protein YndB with AHSA1/START domain